MTANGTGTQEAEFGRLRFDRPHSARIYDFYLGGKTNYAADREAALKVAQGYPGIFMAARHNREFMHRATRHLAREYGIRQWLDIGTGIPTEPNLHQVAQTVAPDARVVYADNDPIVLTYARALLTGTEEGATAYIDGDVRKPQTILEDPQLAATLDMDRPVALSLCAMLHFLTDLDEARQVLSVLVDALPSGSALALTHATADFAPDGINGAVGNYSKSGTAICARPREEVLGFFDGLELVEPGLVPPTDWHPEENGLNGGHLPGMVGEADLALWSGVAFKP